MHRWTTAIAAAGLAGAVLLAGCSDEDLTSNRVFVAPPWTAPESATYRVADRGVDGEGTCELITTPEIEPGQTQLERLCSKDEFTDNGLVVVEADTLRPIRSERVNADSVKGTSTTFAVTYEGDTASFTIDDGDDQNETTRDLPQSTADSPDPGWYDDESLLWLARGITLEDGYRSSYTHVINAGQPRVLAVEVLVSGPEEVDVPAGTFSAWKVRFRRESTIYDVWVQVEAPHQVVQARIEDTVYSLTGTR